ncbi:MAG: dacA [Candidatus Doudnabacteria bacterium]|nr:dacA [Candidatus Doudnabacteria bacterium]
MVIEFYPQSSLLSTNFRRYIFKAQKQNKTICADLKTKINFQKTLQKNTKAEKLAKVFSVLIPVFVFTVFLPSVENTIEAQTVNTPEPAAVLGAFSENKPAAADSNIEPYQVSFDKALSDNAKAELVYDSKTGKELISRNIDKKLEIASLTKLMAAVVAVEQSDFSKPVEITAVDHVGVSPVLNIKTGDSVLPENLVEAMLVGSANDAAVTLANHFGNTADFVKKMNAKAEELGMTNTHYDNPVGFDSENNYSTAADLQKLVNYALKTLPYEQIWQQNNLTFKSEQGNKYSIKNSNALVANHSSIKSIKTGLTPVALGNMIVQAEDSDGNKIISIVLGSLDRNNSTLQAVNYVFGSFVWK